MNAPHTFTPPWWQTLPQLDPAEADWRNTLLRQPPLRYTAGNHETLDWHWQSPQQPGELWLPLQGAEHLLWLRVDTCHGFSGCPPQGWWALQGWARQVAWAIEYAPLVDGLRAALGLDLEPALQTAPEAPSGPAWEIGFSVCGNGRQIAGGVLAWPAGQLLPALPDTATPPLRWPGLRLPARLSLLQLPLPAAELARLLPGAVLLLAPQADGRWPQATLHLAGRQLRASLDGGRLQIGDPIEPHFEELTMSDTPAPLIDAGQLPLQLSIELAALELPLAQVAALTPGQLLQLDTTPEQAQLTLRANGRAIARGELVRLGDWLGLRITERA